MCPGEAEVLPTYRYIEGTIILATFDQQKLANGNSTEVVLWGKGNTKEMVADYFLVRRAFALEKEGSPTSRRSDTQWLDEANVIEALKAITVLVLVPRRKSKKVKTKKVKQTEYLQN